MLGYVKDDPSGAQGWGVGRHLGGEHDTAVHVGAGEFSPGVQDVPKRVNRGDRRSELAPCDVPGHPQQDIRAL